MLLIKKSLLVILMLISFTATLLTSVTAYLKISSLNDVFTAQKFLFYGILLSFAIIAVFLFFIIKCKNIEQELDKIIDSQNKNMLSISIGLKRLGLIGEKLQKLLMQIETVSEKRKQRILAQNNLLQELTKQTNDSIAIIDLKRKIKHISKGMLEKNNLSKTELTEKDISLITGKVQIRSLLSNLEKKHINIIIKKRGKTYKWVAVYNGNNEISYLIVIQE